MTIEIADLPTVPIGVCVWLDCFERSTGTPVRQRFVVDARIAKDEGRALPTVLTAVGVPYGGQAGEWSFLGAGERTFVPYRTRFTNMGRGGNPPFKDMVTEARIASELLAASGWDNDTKAARDLFDWGGPHSSTGTEARVDHRSHSPAKLVDARWRLDHQCEARIEAVRKYACENLLIGADGLHVSRCFPVWLVDPKAQGVEVRLKLVDDWSEGDAPWAFSLDRLDAALRFRDLLAGMTRRPTLPVQGEIRGYDAAWDRRDDLVEFAHMLATRRVPELGRCLPDLPAAAVVLWRDILESGEVVRTEGRPGARRRLADFVALRDALLVEEHGGTPEIVSWYEDTRRSAMRICEVELAEPFAAPALAAQP